MNVARKTGEILRGFIIGTLLVVVMLEIYVMDSGATVFRYQGF